MSLSATLEKGRKPIKTAHSLRVVKEACSQNLDFLDTEVIIYPKFKAISR